MGRKKNPKGIWIPWEVWEDDRLGILDKAVFAVISSLSQGETGCYASNKYLAEFCQCSERKICSSVSLLVETGYMRLENSGGKLRKIFVCSAAPHPRKNCADNHAEFASDHAESAEYPRKNCGVSTQNLQSGDGFLPSLSIDNNNYNNIYNYAREETDTKPTRKEIEDWCRERGSSVNPGRFFEYYEAVHWLDRDGTPVNWKQRILSWEAQEERRAAETGQADKAVPVESSFDTDSFFAAALAHSEVPAADDDVPPWMKGE